MWNLYLDDERSPKTTPANNQPWIVCRSMNEAIEKITELGVPDQVSLDHDLGFNTFSKTNLPSGYDFVKWFANYLQEQPDVDVHNIKFNVHSANPVGAKNMNEYWKSFLNFKTEEKE